MDCDRCKEKSLICGEKILATQSLEKASGALVLRMEQSSPQHGVIGDRDLSITYIPQPPDDARLSQDDTKYLQYACPVVECGKAMSSEFTTFSVIWKLRLLPLPIDSKPIRYSMLAIASSRKDGSGCVQSLVHMNRFYHYIHQATSSLSDASFLDLIYGNHVIYRRGLDAGESLETLCKHLLDITAGVTGLTRGASDTLEELLWTERLWRGNYHPLMFEHLRPLRRDPIALTEHVENICWGFERIWPLLPSNKLSLQCSPWVSEHRPLTLEMYSYYYFLRYLLHLDATQPDLESQGMLHRVQATLRQVLEKILEAGNRTGLDDEFRKIAGITITQAAIDGNGIYTTIRLQQLSVYCFAFLLYTLFEVPQTIQSYHLAISAAIAQCNLCPRRILIRAFK
jgi:hypothetical protein